MSRSVGSGRRPVSAASVAIDAPIRSAAIADAVYGPFVRADVVPDRIAIADGDGSVERQLRRFDTTSNRRLSVMEEGAMTWLVAGSFVVESWRHAASRGIVDATER